KTLKILKIGEWDRKGDRVSYSRTETTHEAKFRNLRPIPYRVLPFNVMPPLDPVSYPVSFVCVDNLDCVSVTFSQKPKLPLGPSTSWRRYSWIQMHHCDEERRLDVEAAVKALIDLSSRGSP